LFSHTEFGGLYVKIIPRIVIGACQGRSGKTTFTLGLLQALRQRGIHVQPFKKGPDYIDPSWLSYAAGKECRNLDAFMMTKEGLINSFVQNSLEADISIVEGAMGLFDGLDVEGSGSTAEIAYMLQAPVILVVNCQRMTRSVAALVNGVVNFDPRIKIGGVILNHVARTRHKNMLISSIEKYCQVPVLGYVPKRTEIVIPDRHLGLIPAGEQEELKETVNRLGQLIEENVNLEELLKIAKQVTVLESPVREDSSGKNTGEVTIGVLRDKVFSFYYPENLDALRKQGAHLVFIDSLKDKCLPKVDGLYIGGGFPEMFAQELEENHDLRREIKKTIEKGLPVYAECGGLMYLGRSIKMNESVYNMVGALPYDVVMEKKPQGHGYTINKALEGNPFFSPNEEIRGHEFHNSRVINLDYSQVRFGMEVKRGKGITGKEEGILYKNVYAGYSHIHVASAPNWARRFVKNALNYQRKSHSVHE